MVRRRKQSDDVDVDLVWKWYKHDGGGDEARNILLEYYWPLCSYWAERIKEMMPSFVDTDDLASIGFFGLLDAIERFDPSRGWQFSTFAMHRIRGSMLDELRGQDWIPRLVKMNAKKLGKASRDLECELGRPPTCFEASQRLGMTFAEYNAMVEETTHTAMISLSEEAWTDYAGNGDEKVSLIEDTKPPMHPLRKMHFEDVRRIVGEHLDSRQCLIIALYYYEDLSMKQIAKVVGLTESRVCQIHGAAMDHLRNALQRRKEELFA